IILGDSTGGNAIDASYYSFLSKSNTGNLSLTGGLSEAGLAILENANKDKLKNIIIISDLDIWLRNPRSGYKFFIEEFENYNNFFYHYYKNLNLLDISRITRMFIEKYVLNREVISIEKDYIKQFDSKAEKKDYYLLIENIKYEKFNFLKDLFEYCEIKNLNCIHANGPIIKNFCENISFQPYLDMIYKQFDLLNINYTKKVFCLENDEYGDSISHVSPSKKKIFTKKYFEILQ
ncbi:hypothetical protein N9A07_02005, partial [Candidatus Pelagibacter ubique]|nr:hypothetical protein [Candidatus Pelagibacter ubique]